MGIPHNGWFLSWKSPLKWMRTRATYHHFRKPPFGAVFVACEAGIVPSIGCSSPWQARLQEKSENVMLRLLPVVHMASFGFIWILFILFSLPHFASCHIVSCDASWVHESTGQVSGFDKNPPPQGDLRCGVFWRNDQIMQGQWVFGEPLSDTPFTAGTGCGIRTDRRDRHFALCDSQQFQQLQPKQVRPSLQGRSLRLRRRCGVTWCHTMSLPSFASRPEGSGLWKPWEPRRWMLRVQVWCKKL